jgi:hypothetical protein
VPADEGSARDDHRILTDLTLLARADHPLAPALLGVLLGVIVVLVAVPREGGDLAAFAHAAPPWADPTTLPPGMRTVPDAYDGMFYYRLALDPLTDRMTDHGITFDTPAYRQQRILYPALAWAISLGDAQRAPLALVVVNVLAMGGLGLVGGAIARDLGRHALWGSLFPLWPGTFVTLTHDLTELVAAALLLAGVWWLRRERVAAGAGALAFAVLARETTVIASATSLLARATGAVRMPARWIALALPLIVLVAWQLVLAIRWGRGVPTNEGVAALWPPFIGIIGAAWVNGTRLAGVDAASYAAFTGFVLVTIAIGALAVRSAPAGDPLAWYAYLALAILLQPNIWANSGILRTLTELGVLTGVAVLGARSILRHAFLAAEIAVYALYLLVAPSL